MHRIGMTLLTLLLLPWPAWSKDLLLFFIQRSKNANEVHYQLRVDERCHIVSDKPVSALWKLREESPEKTETLSVFDQIAYGVVDQKVEDNWVSFSLKALEQKRIKASTASTPNPGTCAPIVQIDIQGQLATLERIYVQTEEGFIKPKVLYVDVFGKSLDASQTPVHERITP